MELGIKGRTALVLASSQGLGKASALSLAREGANLTICSRREGPLNATKQQIQKETKTKVLAIPTDVTDPNQIKHLVKSTMDEYGRIDILVTNSGPPQSGLFMQLTNDDWYEANNGLLMSVVNICREVIPIMQKQRWGRIINITSTSVKQPLGNLMLSSAARMGVVGLAKVMANQYAKDNILINTLCPGPFVTEGLPQMFEDIAKDKGITIEEARKGWVANIPMGRLGEPQEFGDVVAFLASERAGFITGTAIQVDGGRVQGML